MRLSSISYFVVSFSPRFFYTRICMVAPFFYESLSLFHTWLTKLINICDAGTWVSLDLRLRSSKCINGIYIINNVGLKNKGTPLHISCISLFDHMYNRLRCYYSIVTGITIRFVFSKRFINLCRLNWRPRSLNKQKKFRYQIPFLVFFFHFVSSKVS